MTIRSYTAGGALFILLAVYYNINSYPGLGFIDSGELAFCSATMGVPHPTGYPLYLIVSRPSTLLFDRPIAAVTFLASLITALAGVAFFQLLKSTLRLVKSDTPGISLTTFLATLILFIAPIVAEQGVTNEVYALSFLVTLPALLAIMRVVTAESGSPDQIRWAFAGSYLTGLALTNHLSSICLLPALLLMAIHLLRRRFSMARLLAGALIFLTPLTLYAVLPIRAGADPAPIANWGDVTTWSNLYRHVSGWQFRVWFLAGDLAQSWSNLKSFGMMIYAQYPFVVPILSLIGLVSILRARLPVGIMLTLIILTNVVLGISYSIPDIHSYFLPTIAVLLLLAAIGVQALFGRFRSSLIPGGVIGGLLIWQVILVTPGNDFSDYTLPEDYALNIGRSADSGAVIMSDIWDHHGQLYYLQQAEGYRLDLVLVDKELLRRSWYFKSIKQMYPETYAKISDLVPPFMEELSKFEGGKTYDGEKLEFYYQSIITRLLTACGSAYVDFIKPPAAVRSMFLRRQGLLMRVDQNPTTVRLPEPNLIWRGKELTAYKDIRAKEHVGMILRARR